MTKKVLVVCGTRPEIIKMAPVYAAIRESRLLQPLLLHTGQHTDLAEPVYRFFGMDPDIRINLRREKPDLAHLSAVLLEHCAAAIADLKPDAVLVHGDTTSASMAALAAFYAQIPVGHVEAGLRTGDRYSPFPEEMNRTLIGRMAQWHYAPTEGSMAALAREGITGDTVMVTGNTVIDAAHMTAHMLGDGSNEPFVSRMALATRIADRRLVLVTAHRRENWGEGLRNISRSVCRLLADNPDVLVVWPLHANPAVAQTVRDEVAQCDGLTDRLLLCEPLDYTALIWILRRAWLVMTDSGGIQEEAAAFGVPALVLRDSTERPELIEAGGGVLTGADSVRIEAALARFAAQPEILEGMRGIQNPFGDGLASERIRMHLESELAPGKI